MDFACSHCTTALHIDNQQLGTLWNYVRCSDCAKLQLVHPNESKTIRIEKTPDAERIVLATAVKNLNAKIFRQSQVLNLSEEIKLGQVQSSDEHIKESPLDANGSVQKTVSLNSGIIGDLTQAAHPLTPPPFREQSTDRQRERQSDRQANRQADQNGSNKVYSDQEFDQGISNRLRDSIRFARDIKKKASKHSIFSQFSSVVKTPSGFGGMMTGIVVLVSGLALLHTSRMIMNEAVDTPSTSGTEKPVKTKRADHQTVNQNPDTVVRNNAMNSGTYKGDGRGINPTLSASEPDFDFTKTHNPARNLAAKSASDKTEVILKPRQINTRLRVGPSIQFKVVRTANVDETFRVLSWKDNWFEVESMNDPGLTYWVRNDLVMRSEIKY